MGGLTGTDSLNNSAKNKVDKQTCLLTSLTFVVLALAR